MSTPHQLYDESYGGHVRLAWEVVEWLYKLTTVIGFILVLAVSGLIRPLARACTSWQLISLCVLSLVATSFFAMKLLPKWSVRLEYSWKSIGLCTGGVVCLMLFLSSAGALVYAKWFDRLSDGDSASVRYLIVTEHELRGEVSLSAFERYFSPNAVVDQRFPPANATVWRGIGDVQTPGTIVWAYSGKDANGFQAMFYRKLFIREPAFDARKKFVAVVTQTKSRNPDSIEWTDFKCEYWVFRRVYGNWKIEELHGGLSVEEAVKRYDAAVIRD